MALYILSSENRARWEYLPRVDLFLAVCKPSARKVRQTPMKRVQSLGIETSKSLFEKIRTFFRGWKGTTLRVLIAVLPIAWVVRQVDPNELVGSLDSIPLATLAAALLLVLIGHMVAALRWKWLMHAYGATRSPGVLVLFWHVLVATYFRVLPTGLVGEVNRGYRVRHSAGGLLTSYTIVFVDRITGLVGLLLIAVCSMFMAPFDNDAVILALDVGMAVAFVLCLLFLLLPVVFASNDGARARIQRIPLVGEYIARVPAIQRPVNLAGAIVLSVCTQGLVVLYTYLVAAPLTGAATLEVCLRIVPVLILLNYIPITPLAVGQREVVYIYFWGMVGISAEVAVTISLVTFGLLLATSLLGFGCYMIEKILKTHEAKGPESA
jgi:uncharacterized membrane protein YbhN (UPF0104 family)